LFTSSEGAVVFFALSTTHWRWEGRFDEAGKNNLKNLRPLLRAAGDTGLKQVGEFALQLGGGASVAGAAFVLVFIVEVQGVDGAHAVLGIVDFLGYVGFALGTHGVLLGLALSRL